MGDFFLSISPALERLIRKDVLDITAPDPVPIWLDKMGGPTVSFSVANAGDSRSRFLKRNELPNSEYLITEALSGTNAVDPDNVSEANRTIIEIVRGCGSFMACPPTTARGLGRSRSGRWLTKPKSALPMRERRFIPMTRRSTSGCSSSSSRTVSAGSLSPRCLRSGTVGPIPLSSRAEVSKSDWSPSGTTMNSVWNLWASGHRWAAPANVDYRFIVPGGEHPAVPTPGASLLRASSRPRRGEFAAAASRRPGSGASSRCRAVPSRWLCG